MSLSRLSLLLFFGFGSHLATAQESTPPAAQAPERDQQAIAILRQSVAVMASAVPADSSATGTVTVVEGSTTESASIQILTLGEAKTSETLTLRDGQRAVVYSNGDAKEITGSESVNPSLELVLSDQCPDFPLPLLLFALNNPDGAFRYVGQETLNGASVQHVQVWNSFSSKPRLAGGAETMGLTLCSWVCSWGCRTLRF